MRYKRGQNGAHRKSRDLAEKHKSVGFQCDTDKFPRVPKGTVWTGLQSRIPLTIAGLKSSLCIGTHQARATRTGRWRDLFTTLFISNLAWSEFSLVKSKMSS